MNLVTCTSALKAPRLAIMCSSCTQRATPSKPRLRLMMAHSNTNDSQRNISTRLFLTMAQRSHKFVDKSETLCVAIMSSHSSERMHRLSVIYALWGLFFASLSAGLIVAVRPVFRSVVVVDASEPNVLKLRSVNFIRGSRRLMEKSRQLHVAERDMAVIAPSPETPSPTDASPPTPLAVPTNPPTVESQQNGTSETVASGVSTKVSPNNYVAGAMVGLASSIIVCALFMYASDVRERRRANKWASDHGHDDVVDDDSSQKSAFRSRVGDGESQTSAGSMHAESGFWVHAKVAMSKSTELVEYEGGNGTNPQNMLPPMLADEARAEDLASHNLALTTISDDASISRVSTLTMSLKESAYSYSAGIEEKLSRYALESSSHVTELDDAHRVSDDTKLTSLVKGGMDDADVDASVCSSLTGGSHSTAQLLGEDCLDIKFHQTPESTPFDSLETSPETPIVESDNDEIQSDEDDDDFTIDSHEQGKNELVQLEQLLAGIPFDEMSQGTPARQTDEDDEVARDTEDSHDEPTCSKYDTYVRDVCVVPSPTDGKISLGLELLDAATEDGFPTVSSIDLSGPLLGQVLLGDAIVAINEKDTSGFSSKEVMKLVVDTPNGDEDKMIKLTIMSSAKNEWSLSDGEDDSIDLESATEI